MVNLHNQLLTNYMSTVEDMALMLLLIQNHFSQRGENIMYEYHGWITLRESFLNEDDTEENIDEIVSDVNDKIYSLDCGNGLLDLRAVNGEYHLSVSGLLNHKSQQAEELFSLFEFIAENAVGSYGLLYVRDDEDENGEDNKFQVYVMARGKIEEKKDRFLSPFTPTVEDE